MKTSHELARELFELPDIEIVVDDKFCGKPFVINGYKWDSERKVVYLGSEDEEV